MAAFFKTLSDVFSTLGPGVFVPAMLFIIAKFMGVNNKKAFNSALLCAVGLTGFNLVIGSYGGIIAPVVNHMVENSGVNLQVLDTGWQSTSVIAYSTQVGLVFIGVAIFLQMDKCVYGKRPLEQLFVHGLGLSSLRSYRKYVISDGTYDHSKSLYSSF